MDIKLEDWTQNLILDLLSKGVYECDYFEFKEMLPHSQDDRGKERLATACCSFANSEGGFLIFGIKDDRTLEPTARLVGMDRHIDFPALFGSFPQKSEPSIHWIPKNPAMELANGNVINIVFIPKSPRVPHSVGRPEQGLKYPKRTNQGVDYMSSNEIKNAYLGYYEKRLKVQMLYAEIGNIASDAKAMMIPDAKQETHYPFIQFNLTVLETVYPEIFSLICENMDLIGRLMALRNHCKTANGRISHFLSQAALPRSNSTSANKNHNQSLSDSCNKIIIEASEVMKALGPYRN